MTVVETAHPRPTGSVARLDALGERMARNVMRLSIPLNVLFSTSTFNPEIWPATQPFLQQVISLGLWLLLICASTFVRPVFLSTLGTDTGVFIAFYVYAIASVLWTDLLPESLMKSAALAITTFGAYRLATRLGVEEIIKATTQGLWFAAVASLYYVIFLPDVGLDHSYFHDGQWQGIFESKQTLGVLGAHLMFFACYRGLTGSGWLVFLATFLPAIACVAGSASRGGGALAIAACVALLFSKKFDRWTRVLAAAPFVMCLLAMILIGYLYLTGYASIYFFGTEIDFTERTFIWQHALSHFGDAPLFGFGLNGFWTVRKIYDAFEQNHGWVLDNYHNGYIAILVETGLVGFSLFLLSSFLFAKRMGFLLATGSLPRAHCAVIVGFVALSYQINFTETTFLRSTSFDAVLLLTLIFIACRNHTAPAAIDTPSGGTR
jgi:exopolysaccharide production protein ExoQ